MPGQTRKPVALKLCPPPIREARKPYVLGAEMHRQDKSTGGGRTRKYSSLISAITLSVRRMITGGRVGDVIEVYDLHSGGQIGTIKKSATGRIITKWIWEE